MGYESPTYNIERMDSNFSIRFYPFFKTVVMPQSTWNGYSGFNDLFSYISGNNHVGKSMKMTVPVINYVNQDLLTMEFVVPEAFYHHTPIPNADYLSIKTYTNLRLGVIQFRGQPSLKQITTHRNKLIHWLKNQQEIVGETYYVARYNAPFMPGIFKINEVWVTLGNLDKDHKSEADGIEF